jgi:hypothetical protein
MATGNPAAAFDQAHLPFGGDARVGKLAGVKPAPPRKDFVRGGAGLMPARNPTANQEMRPARSPGAFRSEARQSGPAMFDTTTDSKEAGSESQPHPTATSEVSWSLGRLV